MILTTVCVFACSIILSCKKKSPNNGGGGTTTTEENLLIGTDPDHGIIVASSLGAVYDFKIVIKSKMPASGVKIEIECTRDSDNGSVFSQTLNNSATPINISVANLVAGILCTVKITVTSVNKPSNIASMSFKVARK